MVIFNSYVKLPEGTLPSLAAPWQRLLLRGTPPPPPAASPRWAALMGPWPPRRWRAARCDARGSEASAKSSESVGKCKVNPWRSSFFMEIKLKKLRYDDDWFIVSKINGEGTMNAPTKIKD